MTKKNTSYILMAVIGLLLLATGLVLIKMPDAPQGWLRALPYICVGLGCGIFGHGMGELIGRRALKGDPQRARRIEIEQADERNIAVANRAKARAFDLMLPVYGALLLAFALMGVELGIILLLVAAYLFIVACGIYYQMKYNKEM